jgi:hypothetical protein
MFVSGISLDNPIVVSCGSGVTACILALVWNLPCLSWILPCICKAIPNDILFYRGSIELGSTMFQFMMDHGRNGKHNQILITQKLPPLLKIPNSEKATFPCPGAFSLDCQ